MMKKILMSCCIAALFAVPTSASQFTIFHDDFESGIGNWTQFPGSAAALSLFGPDAFKSIDPGPVGVVEGFSARQSALVAGGNGIASFHNFGEREGFLKAEVYLFEDFTTSADPIQAAMTLTPVDGGGNPVFSDFLRIGILQFSGTNSVYSFRTAADGFVQTSVARKSGWTKLGIEVDAPADGGQARFFIDDALVGTSSRVGTNFSAVTLGQNFSNFENFWYDGVRISTIPEPSTMILSGMAGVGLVGYRLRRHTRV